MTSSKDNQDLWQTFLRGVKPLKQKEMAVPLTLSRKILSSPKKDISPLYPVTNLLYPLTDSRQSFLLSSRGFQKNRKINIDATLDLHGEILQNAYIILVRFIERARQLNNQIILVITGKSLGKVSQDRPRLVQMVPLWLYNPPLNQHVRRVIHARREHGGEGAYYVFLKR